jgi:hypothetical protein
MNIKVSFYEVVAPKISKATSLMRNHMHQQPKFFFFLFCLALINYTKKPLFLSTLKTKTRQCWRVASVNFILIKLIKQVMGTT